MSIEPLGRITFASHESNGRGNKRTRLCERGGSGRCEECLPHPGTRSKCKVSPHPGTQYSYIPWPLQYLDPSTTVARRAYQIRRAKPLDGASHDGQGSSSWRGGHGGAVRP